MAHFYGTVQGHRGQASRTGSKSSGLIATATGWDIGGEVTVDYSKTLQTDVVRLCVTNGSNSTNGRLIASFAYIDGKLQLLETDYPEALV